VATPTPVTKPTPPETKEIKPDTSADDAVLAAVKAWAEAWSKRDMDAYYAAYARDFDGGKPTRKAWEQERRERIVGKRHISVDLSDVKVSVNGNKAVVRFHQDYKADTLSVSSGKRLDLVRQGNNWVIVKESTGS
jgi:ketosteroid isomerase-like protein